MLRGRLRASRPGLRTRGQYQTPFFSLKICSNFLTYIVYRESIVIMIEIDAEFCQKCTKSPKIAKINVGQYVCCCSLGSSLALKLLDLLQIFTKPVFKARIDAQNFILFKKL